jgi:hypothetical protein
MTETQITVNPRDFIRAPYIQCPYCKANEFGVWIVGSGYYLRRCKACLCPSDDYLQAKYPLPPLNKKVIYLDQFVVSSIVKTVSPDTKACSEEHV